MSEKVSKKTSENKRKNPQRKLQVSNGHYLDLDQLARLMITVKNNEASSLSLDGLAEETGLPRRQVRNRISIGRAIGVFNRASFSLTEFGSFVAEYDQFFDAEATLELVHYRAASTYENLIWYELFNTFAVEQDVFASQGLLDFFRETLEGLYSKESLTKHVRKELRFLLDAYTGDKLKRLEVLLETSDGRYMRGRHRLTNPLVAAAIIYRYCEAMNRHVCSIDELCGEKGAPGLLFGMSRAGLREMVEGLHEMRWVRYETTHSLDQIRLISGFDSMEFTRACYEGRSPNSNE
jgi:hypothetical protein